MLSSTLIDLTFINTPDRVVCSGVSHIGISDHTLVFAFRKVPIESTKMAMRPSNIGNLTISTLPAFAMIFFNKTGITLKAVLIQIQRGRHGNNFFLNVLTSTHHFVKSILAQ